jgi:hypothetical protein
MARKRLGTPQRRGLLAAVAWAAALATPATGWAAGGRVFHRAISIGARGRSTPTLRLALACRRLPSGTWAASRVAAEASAADEAAPLPLVLTVSYDGTDFAGFSDVSPKYPSRRGSSSATAPPVVRTVQAVLEKALAQIYRGVMTGGSAGGSVSAAAAEGRVPVAVQVQGASRTDRGVHARGQVCTFAPPRGFAAAALPPALSRAADGENAPAGENRPGTNEGPHQPLPQSPPQQPPPRRRSPPATPHAGNPFRLVHALNRLLPPDVRVTDLQVRRCFQGG